MTLFKERTTPVQNIVYISIMSAVNIVFVLLGSAIPVLMFLLVFLLPLSSAIVLLYCQKRYYPIYFIATLALCTIISIGFTFFDTLIYVLPSLITGFVYGLSYKKGIPPIISMFCNITLQFLLSLLTSFLLVKVVSGINPEQIVITFFGLTNFQYKRIFVLVFYLIISMIQITLTSIFINFEMKKLYIGNNLFQHTQIIVYFLSISLNLLAILSYFYFYEWTIVIIILTLPLYVYELIDLIQLKNKIIYILLGVCHLSFIFIFAFLYKSLYSPNQFVILVAIFMLTTIIDFVNNYCFANKMKCT